MRILLACPYAWDVPGGVQVHIRQLASHLRDRGHDVLVLTPARGPVQSPDVRVVGRPIAFPYQGTVAPIAPWPGVAVRIAREMAAFRPDVVHVHEPLTPSTSMYTVLRSSVPVVATFHAYADRSRLLDVAAPILGLVWRRLSVRIAVSRAAAEFVGSRFHGDVRILPNGLDVGRFVRAQPAPDLPEGRRMLWVGRLDRQKGFPVAVRAFQAAAKEFPDLSFVVVGEGRDRVAVERLPPAGRACVRILGAVPNDLLPPYLAGADVFVSPATGQESFGYVLVEAMAAGVPVVASDIPGYREVVTNEVDGLLVPPGDPDALAAAIARILRDPALADHLREAGRTLAARFDWDVLVGDVERAYRDALESPVPLRKPKTR